MWKALKHRDFRLLFAGQSVSALGDQTYQVALSWLIASRFGSVGTMAMVYLATSIPAAVTRPISGSFIDKYSPRTMMIWLNLVMAALMGLFTSVSFSEWGGLALFLLFAALFGVFGSTLEPAFFTAVPRATNSKDLESANSLVIFLYSVAGLIGPLFSAFLIARFGTTASFSFNALSFLLAALLSLMIVSAPRVRESASQPLPKVKEAWDWIKQHPWAMRLFAGEALFNFALGFFWVSLPILLHNSVQLSIVGFGSVYSFVFFGSVAATLVSGMYLKQIKDRGLIAYTSIVAVAAAMVFLLWMVESLVMILCLAAAMGFCLPWFDIITRQTIQEGAPEGLIGRLTSIGGFLTVTPRLIAYLLLLVWQAPLPLLMFSSLLLVLFVGVALGARRGNKENLSASL